MMICSRCSTKLAIGDALGSSASTEAAWLFGRHRAIGTDRSTRAQRAGALAGLPRPHAALTRAGCSRTGARRDSSFGPAQRATASAPGAPTARSKSWRSSRPRVARHCRERAERATAPRLVCRRFHIRTFTGHNQRRTCTGFSFTWRQSPSTAGCRYLYVERFHRIGDERSTESRRVTGDAGRRLNSRVLTLLMPALSPSYARHVHFSSSSPHSARSRVANYDVLRFKNSKTRQDRKARPQMKSPHLELEPGPGGGGLARSGRGRARSATRRSARAVLRGGGDRDEPPRGRASRP